jgi:hypothetical protein
MKAQHKVSARPFARQGESGIRSWKRAGEFMPRGVAGMPEPTFSMTADDDLPRTIRREREAREREARERQAAASAPALQREGEFEVPAPAATVVDFDVPLAKMAMFFVRAVFAAIPALLILMALLWVLGHTLQTFFPQLLKMKILIYMP